MDKHTPHQHNNHALIDLLKLWQSRAGWRNWQELLDQLQASVLGVANPMVANDKLDYAPGKTTDINTNRFTPGSTLSFAIADDPASDNNGSGSGTPDALNATLQLSATGSDGQMASYTFTDSEPSVVTDKADYAPGEKVTITSSGFAAGSTITFTLADDPSQPGDDGEADVYAPFAVTDGGEGDQDGVVNGQVITTWLVPTDNNGSGSGTPDAQNATVQITAQGSDGQVATTTFTDTVQRDYNQWQNYIAPEWQNGALNAQNNVYFEGEYKPHALDIAGVTEGVTYVFWIVYDYLSESEDQKYGGFDFLDTWNKTDFSPNVNPDIYPNGVAANTPIAPASDKFQNGGLLYAWQAKVIEIGDPVIYSGDGIGGANDLTQRAVGIVFTPDDGDTISNETIDVNLYWSLRLAAPNAVAPGADGASKFPGASLQTRLDIDPGNSLSINPSGSAGDPDPNGGLSSAYSAYNTDVGGGNTTRSMATSSVVRGLISGYKWNDLDNDGEWDSSETGLGGWTINLTGTSQSTGQAVDLSVITNSDTAIDANKDGSINAQDIGYYEFSPLDRGTYTISEVQLSPSWKQTYPVAPSTYSITISQGAPRITGDYGVGKEDLVNSIGNFGNYFGAVPAINLIKDGTWADGNGDGNADVGELINYTFTVTNTGNVTLTGVTVTDPKVTVVGGPLASLAPGAADSTSFTGSYTITQADIDAGFVDNTALTTGKPPTGDNVTDTDTHNETLTQAPLIELIKDGTWADGNGDGNADVGELINYTFTVTNTGNVTLTGVTVTDPKVTVVGGPLASLAPGAADSTSFTGSYTITQADIDAGFVDNTALTTGKPPTGDNVTDTDTHNETLTQAPLIELIKDGTWADGNGDGNADVGELINYTFTVTNTGNVTLTGVTVTDPKVTVVGGPLASLAPGAADSTSFTGSYTITQADIDAGFVDNTALTTGKPPTGDNVTDTDTHNETLTQAPLIELIKDGTWADGNGDGNADVGELINYTFTVTNTGNVTLTGVTVTDPKVTVVGGPLASLAPGAADSTSFTGSYTITQADIDAGFVDNTALTTGKPPTGDNVTDTDTHNETLTQAPLIAIDKQFVNVTGGDGDALADAVGDVLNYTVAVSNTGNVTLTGVTVVDPLTLQNISGVTLAVGETKTYNTSYILTQADLDKAGKAGSDGDIDNTATAASNQTGSVQDSVEVPLVYDPKFDISKTASVADGTADTAGEIINYTITLKNTGNISLTGVTVTDKVESYTSTAVSGPASGDSSNAGVLDVGETWIYNTSYTLTQADLNNMGGGDDKLDNTATGDTKETDPKSTSASVPLVNNKDFAQIAPTGTTCDQYINGTPSFSQFYASQGGVIQYNVNNQGKIGSTNPGVFFYYTGLSNAIKGFDGTDAGTAPDPITVKIDQSDPSNLFPAFTATKNDVKLFKVNDIDGNGIDPGDTCTQVQLASNQITLDSDGSAGDVKVKFTPDAVGSLYAISVQYKTGSVVGTQVGTNAASWPTVNYTFNTDVGDNGSIDETAIGGITIAPKFSALTLNSAATTGGATLTQEQVDPVVGAAVNYWAAQGISNANLDKLRHTDVLIGDLGGTLLGGSDGFKVRIDDDAAGHGWSTCLDQVAAGQVDLYSTVVHEFGHMLGYEHGVMGEALGLGERHLPFAPLSAETHQMPSLLAI